jgi:hypothetical protein
VTSVAPETQYVSATKFSGVVVISDGNVKMAGMYSTPKRGKPMLLSVSSYLCPFCEKWHSEGDPDFTAHWPTDREFVVLEKGEQSNGRDRDTD